MPEKFNAIKGGLLQAIEENYRKKNDKNNDNKEKKEGGNKKNKDKKNKDNKNKKINGGALIGSLNGSDNDYLLLPAGNAVERPFTPQAQDGGAKKRKSSKNKQSGGQHGIGSGSMPASVEAPLTILMDDGGSASASANTQGSVDGVLQLGGNKSKSKKVNDKKNKEINGGSDASFGGDLAYAASTESPMTILMPESSYAGGDKKKRNSKKNQKGGTCGSQVSIYPPNDMMPAGANQYAAADMYTAGEVYAPVDEDKYSYILSGASSSAVNVPVPNPPIQMGGKKNKSNKGGDKDNKQNNKQDNKQENENKGGDKKNKDSNKKNNKNLIGGLAQLTEALSNLTGGYKKP
jgi:hypothetical protein